MVNEVAQLYTIEGIGAAILMVVTSYLVINSTILLSPQDVHVTDMQLQQLGHDALAMADIPDTHGDRSPLREAIEDEKPGKFESIFNEYINQKLGVKNDTISFNVSIWYRNPNSPTLQSRDFCQSPDKVPYLRENAVKVSRLVYIDKPPSYIQNRGPPHHQIVLVEVLLWRS